MESDFLVITEEDTPQEYPDYVVNPNKYLSYRFNKLDIGEVTVENYKEKLVNSLAQQVSMFLPPSGSFETPDLHRYLELVRSYETSTNDLILGLSLADLS